MLIAIDNESVVREVTADTAMRRCAFDILFR